MDSELLVSSLPRVNEKRLFYLPRESSNCYVMGVDEAGRGPLAGPVVAAAFLVMPAKPQIFSSMPKGLAKGVTDSKQLSEHSREYLYLDKIKGNASVEYSVAVVDHKVIDKINILQATFRAMTEAVNSLISVVTARDPNACFSVLVDGNKVPPQLQERSELYCESIVKGDSVEFVIAAASICAKVERDHIMLKLHAEFPAYGFGQHKGYPTGAHVAAIATHGPCKYHRMTFGPLKRLGKKKVEKPVSKTEISKLNSDPREERLRRRNLLK